MLFCIDVGNTNIVLGVTDGNRIIHHWRIRTEKEITADELGILVGNFFQWVNLGFEEITDTIVSCVVPPLLNTIDAFSGKYFGVRPLIVGPGLKTGMPIRYDNPKEVGADRIVNAVAAYETHKSALVVVDFGTATTFDYINRSGDYMGGAISPGVIISCEALFQEASKLPRVEIFSRPKTIIAKDTISSMNAGIIYGYAGLVDGIVNRMEQESGEAVTVVATGGLAPIISEVSETIDEVEEFLTLQGLIILFNKNR